MSSGAFLRGFFVFLFSAIVAWVVYEKAAQEREPEAGRPRHTPDLPADLLPWFLLLLFAGAWLYYGAGQALTRILSMCFGIFLHISVYYVLLLLVLPLLRRYFSARVCAMLWLLPNYLYLSEASFMRVSRPALVLRLEKPWMHILCAVWLCGFLAVLGWKTLSHLLFRRALLRHAAPVSDEAVLALWKQEQERAGEKKCSLRLVVSPAATTPLSIGFFRRTIRVVLPPRDYTPEELSLIFRHELVHIGREDSRTKFFLVFCTAMCWFNPLMWLAARRSSDDLELCCDEAVLLDAEDETRRQYAELLLTTAGDERGFTTCLSATASALRYRLGSIIKPRRRLTGGLLAGAIFFLLLISSGHVALAYDGACAEELLFPEDASTYTLSSIIRHDEDGYRAYGCKDEQALKEYLAGLHLYRLSGNFSKEDDYMSILLEGADGVIDIILRDGSVSVSSLHDPDSTEIYYCADAMDWAYLSSLLVAQEKTG